MLISRWIYLTNSQMVWQAWLYLSCYDKLVRCVLLFCLMQMSPIMHPCLAINYKFICITDSPKIRGYIFGSSTVDMNVLWRIINAGIGNDSIILSGPGSTTFFPTELMPERSPNKSVKSFKNNTVLTFNEKGKIKSITIKIPYSFWDFTLTFWLLI